MKPGIKSQAKNEVGDLLNEYVVSPIDSHIQEVLQKSEASLGSKMGKQTQKTEENLTAQIARLNGTISKIRDKVDHELPDDISENILNRLGELQQTLAKLPGAETFSQLEAGIAETVQKSGAEVRQELASLSGTVEQRTRAAEEAIRRQFDTVQQALDKKPDTETLSRLEVGIAETVQKSGAEVRQEVASLSGTVEQRTQVAAETICKQIGAVQQALDKKPDTEAFSQLEIGIAGAVQKGGKEIQRELTSLSGTVEQRIRTAEETLCEQITSVQQELSVKANNETFSQLETGAEAEKRYKMLLMVLLTIEASNLLGIIVLAVLISQLF